MRRPTPKWHLYRSLTPDTGVARYALGDDYLLVEFKSRDVYRYDYTAPGRHEVETMKQLAQAGSGLSAYISQHVGNNYAAKTSAD